MVVAHVKISDDKQFLFQTTCNVPVDTLQQQVIEMANLISRIEAIVSEAEDLVKYGPMNSPSEQNLAQNIGNLSLNESVENEDRSGPNPAGNRSGHPPNEDMANVINRTLGEAMSIISKDQVRNKVSITPDMLHAAINNIRGAIMIAYPMGLPEYDPVRCYLEQSAPSPGEYDPKAVSLWWANRELLSGDTLSQYIGKNEKSTFVVKIATRGNGPPPREPAIDQEAQKAMLSFYHKKQEEQKKLEEANDDTHLNSPWANPKALKNAFTGLGNVSWRPV